MGKKQNQLNQFKMAYINIKYKHLKLSNNEGEDTILYT